MPLKSDSTARRERIMVAMVKAARAAAGMSRRFAKERRGEDSDMVASWRSAIVAAVTSAKRYRDIEAERAEKFPQVCTDEIEIVFLSAGAGTEGRARGEGAGAHSEARSERRGNGAGGGAPARAMGIAAAGRGGNGAEPMTAR